LTEALHTRENIITDASKRCLFVAFRLLLRNQSSVFIVGSVVSCGPVFSADVAELMTAITGHVVAPLVSFNNCQTFTAAFVFKVFEHELQLVLVAISLVLETQALRTEVSPAFDAYQSVLMLLGSFIDGSLTILRGTQDFVGVFEGGIEGMHFSVLLLDGQGQSTEELPFLIK
jgi:uncharacterized protein YaiE (UPF0345 family)